MKNDNSIIIFTVWFGLLYILDKIYSKKDRRFRLGYKPFSMSFKGWLYSIVLSAVAIGVLILDHKK